MRVYIYDIYMIYIYIYIFTRQHHSLGWYIDIRMYIYINIHILFDDYHPITTTVLMIIIPSRADNTLCFLNGYMFFRFQCWHLVLGPCKARIFAVEIPRLLAAMVVATAEKRCTATSERRRYPWVSQSGQVSAEIWGWVKTLVPIEPQNSW